MFTEYIHKSIIDEQEGVWEFPARREVINSILDSSSFRIADTQHSPVLLLSPI